jgi:hypothetical protein
METLVGARSSGSLFLSFFYRGGDTNFPNYAARRNHHQALCRVVRPLGISVWHPPAPKNSGFYYPVPAAWQEGKLS